MLTRHHAQTLRNLAATAFAPAALTLVACASTPTESTMAAKIGCPAEKITILEHEPDLFHFNEERWVATCNGRKFYCSSAPGQGQQNMRCLQAFRHHSDDSTTE